MEKDLIEKLGIYNILPFLQNDEKSREELLKRLQEAGVEEEEDMQYLKEDDVIPPLKKVKARKLLEAFGKG